MKSETTPYVFCMQGEKKNPTVIFKEIFPPTLLGLYNIKSRPENRKSSERGNSDHKT